MKKSNYRPISILNVFSKVLERFLLNQMVPYLDNVLSTYLSAYRKGYSWGLVFFSGVGFEASRRRF